MNYVYQNGSIIGKISDFFFLENLSAYTKRKHSFEIEFVMNLKIIEYSVPTSEPKSCPECRQPVTMTQTRRIYFTLSTTVDNIQNHLEFLDQVILNKNSKLHMATMQLEKLKSEWTNKLREKDYEIQRLYEKLKHREQDYEVQKLHAKIEKLKLKLREVSLNNILNV